MLTYVRLHLFWFTAALLPLALVACGGGNSSVTGAVPPTTALIFPGTASVAEGQSVQFVAFVPSLPNSAFTWSASAGTITSTGAFTAPSSLGTITVTATSQTNSAFSATATVTVASSQALSVSGTVSGGAKAFSALAVPAGASVTFTALQGTNPVQSQWFVDGIPNGDTLDGTIDAAGVYAAPLMPPPNGSVTITALSGTNSGTAAVTILFSNKSCTGSYAFSYTGTDGSFLSFAGSFSMDGNGGISAGVEDGVSLHSGKTTQAAFTGTYSVNVDGSATATITTVTPATTATLQFILTENTAANAGRPAQHALLIRFGNGASDTATGSGTIDQQNSSLFTAATITGNYAFSLSGFDKNANLIQLVGKFNATGVGDTIPAGFAEQDINYKGLFTGSAADETVQGSYTMDPTFGGSNGRGVVTLTSESSILGTGTTTFQFAFYIVDNTHLKVIETTDTTIFLLAGDFFSALNMDGSFTETNAMPSGTYAFTLGGTGTAGPYASGGLFSSNGMGAISSGTLDINNGGVHLQFGTSISGSYTVDANLGRVTMAFTLGSEAGTQSFAAYTTSSGSLVLVEEDGSASTTGFAYLQTATTALQQGNYGLNLTGAANTANGPIEQDVVGQAATFDGTVFTGALDINNFITPATSLGEVLTPASIIMAPSSDGRGSLTLATSSANFPFNYYIVDNNTVLLLANNSARVMTGVIARQF